MNTLVKIYNKETLLHSVMNLHIVPRVNDIIYKKSIPYIVEKITHRIEGDMHTVNIFVKEYEE